MYIKGAYILETIHLSNQMTGQLKVCPDKWSSWQDIVQWAAIILIPGIQITGEL